MIHSLGVRTRRIDMWTFGLGAGLAGLAGCALSQVAGVTPDMGQNYIVDSFMVVVTGGVGKLAGAIWAEGQRSSSLSLCLKTGPDLNGESTSVRIKLRICALAGSA